MRGDWHIVEELLISSTAFPIRGDSSTSVENDRPDSTYHVALLSPSFLPSFPPFLPFPTSLPRPRGASVSYFHSPGEFHFSSYLRRRAWMKRAIDIFFFPLPSPLLHPSIEPSTRAVQEVGENYISRSGSDATYSTIERVSRSTIERCG